MSNATATETKAEQQQQSIQQSLEQLQKDVAEIKQILVKAEFSRPANDRAQFATKVRKMILASPLNIRFIDDKLEGDVYEFIADRLWDLVFSS